MATADIMDEWGTFHPNWDRKLHELCSLGRKSHGVPSVTLYDKYVWFAVVGTFIVSPYFFETMLEKYVISDLQQGNIIENIIWMQEAALPHNPKSYSTCAATP